MNKLFKLLIIGVVGLCCSTAAVAQSDTLSALPVAGGGTSSALPASAAALDFYPSSFSYDPANGFFIAIDSIDCAIDWRVREGDSTRLVGRYVTDSIYKRHDLAKILRPRSVAFVDGYVVFLAASIKDSSYIGVLGLDGANGVKLVARAGMGCISRAFRLSPDGKELIVVGNNPMGYNLNVFDISDGIDKVSSDKCFSSGYRVKKQSEKIKESDPYGVGLTVVAVVVVFFALLCVAIILFTYGKAIVKVQKRHAKKAAIAASNKTGKPVAVQSVDTAGEVYAAIAAAVYLYNEELHDDEDGIITIQKVERAWTPWNAKFYNMNKYFKNNR